MTVRDAIIEMGSLNSMCDKSDRDQVEHLTVRDKVALTLSLSLSGVHGGREGTHECVCMCKHNQSSALLLGETVTPSVSCLKSDNSPNLCHNLHCRDFDLISFPYHLTNFHR